MRGSAVSPFTPQDYTLGDMFKQAGYRNAAFGKWGLGSLGTTSEPRYKGFDEWLGFLDDLPAHNYYPETLDRARDGDEHVFALSGNKDNKKGTYACDFFTESAMRFMDFSKPEELNYFRPYFIYLAYQMPHANIELGQATGNGMEVPSDAPYSTEPWPQPERNKAAMITRMDSYVGKILDMLKAQKNDRNTIIIFSSDNGPHSEGGVDQKFFKGAGPFKGGKRDLYEGGIRIPMIVRWPIRIKAGSTCDTPLAFWDVLPTLAEIARVEPPKGIDGISFLPTLTGGKQTNQHEFLYWEVHDKGFKQAVRMGDWKAVRLSADGPLELYNLKSDPGETKNVADQNTEVLAKINEYLKTARTDDPNWPIQKTLPAEPK
jgi:arylsulfatase A-like enzyme